MARSLNSRCDFENGFFSCDLPEDAILLIVKVKTKTGNHTLVEDTEKRTEKFRPWKKLSKEGKQFPRKFPGVLTPKKSDISVTSDSGQCPSPTEHEYRPKYFEEPECIDSDKENMPPIESITPPSLQNLSIEEEKNNEDNEHEATSWEASVARNVELLPRSSSPYPKRKTRTLEDLETDMDDNMVDMTNFFDRPSNERRSPRPTLNNNSELCPTPQNSPTNTPKSSVPTPPTSPTKPHRNEIRGILPDKRRVPRGWPACLRRQPPRVAFRNNDIYVVDDEYEEPRERHPKVQYKLTIADNPAVQNMPHEADYSDNNYESIDETTV